jgi:hypothetical protein
MTTIDTAVASLTADDVASLRKADSITFHYFRDAGVIRTHLRGGYAAPRRTFTARQQRMFPDTNSYSPDRQREINVITTMHGYADNGATGWRLSEVGSSGASNPAAFHMNHSGQFSPKWMTIANLIHAGDFLHLVWTADNNTETLRDLDLHADELVLKIERNGRIVHTLHVAHSVAPDNSARMVQRYGSSNS